MKNKFLVTLLVVPFVLAGCANNPQGSSSSSSSGGSSGKSSSSTSSEPPSEDVVKYRESLKNTSVENHLYVHYYRFNQDYDDWDIWSWAYKPSANEGYRFDWDGRTTNTTNPEQPASGTAKIYEYMYACCDIDLTHKFYNGGWNDTNKKIGGVQTCFYRYSIDPNTKEKVYSDELDSQVGIQIVKSDTRIHGTGQFWENDGSNLYIKLADYALELDGGKVAYHIFVDQDHVQEPSLYPTIDAEDPFIGDDGKNVTYGDKKYNNVNWTDKGKVATAKAFLVGKDGGAEDTPLQYGAGVGYQIMVSSFADSDGDGSGDILGITKKIEEGYFNKLGVNVLWLTPIQLSDSYHGYDISDYVQVDPKFGSRASSHVEEGEDPTCASAMEDYIDLLDAAHEKGMAVVMDLVLNHTSTTNRWYISSAQLDDETRGYYQWGNHDTQSHIKVENYWYPYGSHVYSYYAKFGSSMPELNYAYQDTRDAVKDMALYWLELGVDGFRMDAVKHIFLNDEVQGSSNDTVIKDVSVSGDYSSNLTKNLNFWKELNYEIKSLYPNAFFVGENFDGNAYHVAPYYEGFDSCFDFYSYFNLTSIAAKSYRNGSSGAFSGSMSKFLGDYNFKDWTDDDRYNGAKDKSQGNIMGTPLSLKYGGIWSLKDVYSAQNQYRTSNGKAMNVETSTDGYDMIAGNFTSNHDIARCINRIAGNSWSIGGLEAQGSVDTSTYAKLEKLATCVEIIELMLPGCTWIYYGDEIGMTGNFKKGQTADSAYADLWYRQPMKWVDSGKVGDGSMTCGYGVTGSSAVVEWDDVNKSSTVKSAASQVGVSGSHFETIAAFAKAKSTTPALIRGNFVPYNWGTNTYVANFLRKLGNKTYHVVVNLGSSSLDCGNPGLSGTVVASYNNATKRTIPAYSAILLEE